MNMRLLLPTVALGAMITPTARAAAPLTPPFGLQTSGAFAQRIARVSFAGESWMAFTYGGDIAAAPVIAFDVPSMWGLPDLPLPAWYGGDAHHYLGLTAGDVNGDGYEDLVTASLADPTGAFDTGGVQVRLGSAAGVGQAGTWIAGGPAGSGFAAADVVLGDLDADGDLDLAVAVLWEGVVGTGGTCTQADVLGDTASACVNGVPRLFRNDGTGTFSAWAWTPAGSVAVPRTNTGDWAAVSLDLADFDADGWLDLALGARQVAVFKGLAAGGAAPFETIPWDAPEAGQFTYDVAPLPRASGTLLAVSAGCLVADASCPPSDSALRIFLPFSSGPTVQELKASDANVDEYAGGIDTADLDGDGLTDLLAGSFSSGGVAGPGDVLVFPGRTGATPLKKKAETLPSLVPTTPFAAMGSDVRVDRWCVANASASRTVVSSFPTTGTQSVFTLPSASVEAIDEVALIQGAVTTILANGGTAPLARWTTGQDRTWVALSPPLAAGAGKVRITYRPLEGPDIAVANTWPYTDSALWCNLNAP